jgi:hypothetical protein
MFFLGRDQIYPSDKSAFLRASSLETQPTLGENQTQILKDFENWLVVELATPLKNDGVSWDDYSIPNCFWKVIQNSMVPVTTNQKKSVGIS